MKLLKTFNEENVSVEELHLFKIHPTVRAIIVDDNNIAMLHSRALNYYTLPGGGVDEGESLPTAIIRECKEETGYTVEVISEVEQTKEIQRENKLINYATCFVVKIIGERGDPEFMGDEVGEDFVTEWMTATEAKEHIRREIPLQKKLYHRYVSQRVLAFLEEAFK